MDGQQINDQGPSCDFIQPLVQDKLVQDKQSSKMIKLSGRAVFFYALVVVIIGFIIGFFSGYFTNRKPCVTSSEDNSNRVSQRLMDLIEPQRIKAFHRNFTVKPHFAGTTGEKETAVFIRDTWIQQGLESVRLVPYEVLLSYPNRDDPSRITLYDENNKAVYVTQLFEKILRPEQNRSDVLPPFNVFSPPGDVTGDMVYVNYGRVEDFDWLRKSAGIDVRGKICIARYGKVFRADKASLGHQNGCIGMIFYTDPSDYAVDGADTVYPDSWWLPGTGVQRGTVKKNDGDPLTPMYPSIESAFRLNVSEANLPKIPAHPIGYDDARVLLGHMTGPEVPELWRGKLNITYRYGPGFTDNRWKAEMHITTQNKKATTQNVIGFIEGSTEPDRYVIIGDHYDAHVFGAVDPNSGTAAMLEVSRAFVQLVKEGWRPRRTIVFCAWGAEEPGIIGSHEWVENFGRILGDRTVAYVNVDGGVRGQFALRARSLPLLNRVIIDVTKVVPNPDEAEISRGHLTVYDTWFARVPSSDKTRPKIATLGSGSDFAPFISGIGVTAADLVYYYDESTHLSSYPLYHSAYDSAYLFENYIDPEYKFSVAVSRVWAVLTLRLANSVLLPFGVSDYAKAVRGYLVQLENGYGKLLISRGMETSLVYLRRAVQNFTSAAEDFEERVKGVDSSNVLLVRQYNDQMMQLERAFIDPMGLPNRPALRHVLFAPSAHNYYAGSTFPGLVDSLYGLDNSTDITAWRVVEKQLSIVTYFIEAAANSLAKPTQF